MGAGAMVSWCCVSPEGCRVCEAWQQRGDMKDIPCAEQPMLNALAGAEAAERYSISAAPQRE